MQKNTFTEKYNIILIVLFFLVPILAINSGFYFFAVIKDDFERNEQEKNAVREAEVLAVEAKFSNQLSILFRKFFDVLKNDSEQSLIKDNSFNKHLEHHANIIFDAPFPKYSLYVFKLDNNTHSSELLFSKGDIKGGKKGLCLSFEYLYDTSIKEKNEDSNNNKNENFAKNLLGKHTQLKAVAKSLRGLPVNIKYNNQFALFIWDYIKTKKDPNIVYGSFLICEELDKHPECGRWLALKNLKSRCLSSKKMAFGAFLPIYKDYGKPTVPYFLEKFKKFKSWADKITIQEESKLETWLINSLPQRVPLDNYTGYCHLERGDTHIAVVLVKAIKGIRWPKWIIFINILFPLILFIIISLGIGFGYWPQISLTLRFTLMYILAGTLPLSLLFVASYGYFVKYKNTSINQVTSDLQSVLKSIDSEKTAVQRKYTSAFVRALNDEKMISLIKEKGVENHEVVQRVLEIFEGNKDEFLPVLGIKILDEAGNGAFIKGNTDSDINAEHIIKAFSSAQVKILRRKLEEEYPDAKQWMKEYEQKNPNENLANKGYETVAGQSLDTVMSKHLSVPISRRIDDYVSFQLFDYIKINNKARYILFVVWDDKALDEQIVQKAFNNYIIAEPKYNFAGYRIKAPQNVEPIGDESRHGSQKVLSKIKEIANLISLENKPRSYDEEELNTIFFAMPALNFNQMIFIGWVDRSGLDFNISVRKTVLSLLVIISIIILWLCSIKSASVFLKPVSALKGALDEVSLGNLKVNLSNTPNDELGQLADEFSNMINGLREKERLSKLISDQAVQALKKNSDGLLSDTESFNGVALVSDIRNFTGMSEQYDPIKITDLLNEHFAEMAKIISDNGGLIYKFIGDAIEAVFPEKTELEGTASERAFKAGCLMISKLATINNRRIERKLFPYRIGVGLCYGTMFSGSVGSLETRLDYSILGDPLKKAAKFEALSIQNPSFPLVIGIDIAENIAKYGLGFNKIDSKGQDFIVYTLDAGKNEYLLNKHVFLKTEIDKKDNKSESADLARDEKVFSLQSESGNLKKGNALWLTWFIILLVSVLITLGANQIYTTSIDDLKTDSDKESLRLIAQLNCNDVLMTSFEALCFDFYEDLRKAIHDEDKTKNIKEAIENITKKYESRKQPIPNYCCCLFNFDDNSEQPRFISKGFSEETSMFMYNYSLATINDDTNKQKENIYKIIGKDTDLFSMRGVYNRRSALATIEKQDMYLDTDRIYDKDLKKLKTYVFCSMPKDMPGNTLADYYKILAGNSLLLAFNCGNEWVYSESFTDYEKKFLLNNVKNTNLLKEKGYKTDKIKIGDKIWNFYVIKKELALNYRSTASIYSTVFIFSILLFIILSFITKKFFIHSIESVAGKLKVYIITFTILPLVVVGFVSYLFVIEDYNANKSDTRFRLNQIMDEVENKELYYQPFSECFLNKVSMSDIVINHVNKINSCKNKEERDELIKNFSKDLRDLAIEKKYTIKKEDKIEKIVKRIGSDQYFLISEIIVSGKDDWVSSVRKGEFYGGIETSLSDIGKFVSTIAKEEYFKGKESLKDTAISGEVDKLIVILTSVLGAEFTIKFINLPKNLIFVSASFSIVAFYTSPMPSANNSDYILQALVFFKNEFKPHVCEIKNNENISLKEHFAKGSKDSKLFCFFSPNICVGEYFFYNNSHYPNVKEEIQTVKELGLASSWINSSFSPVSRDVELYGPHMLEARRGNIVSDNVYAAISSEIPIINKAKFYLFLFGLIIFISLILIYCVAQNSISDLIAPINRLMEGAISAAREDYRFRTYYMRKDELGVLCDSFDKMMKGLEEKQLMNRMVSKTALKVSSNVSDVDSKKINAVLMYVSVPNFDVIMKNTEINQLFLLLRKQVAAIAEIVISNGGDIDKIMGEKMLIAFHIGDKRPEDAAVLACKVAHDIESSNKINFKVSVGVNYGQVISGFLGVGEKRDFTIIGDPVNVAARIAVLGEKLDKDNCLISETIYYYINNYIKANLYGEVELKGKSQPMKVYQII